MTKNFFQRVMMVVLLLSAGVATAQTITLKVHHFLPAVSSAHRNFIVPWCDKIAKDSGGKLKCQIYPQMQLSGTPQQLFDQAKERYRRYRLDGTQLSGRTFSGSRGF